MCPSALTEMQKPRVVHKESKRKLDFKSIDKVFVRNAASGEIVLSRSHSNELQIEFTKIACVSGDSDPEGYWRSISVDIVQKGKILYLSITQPEPPLWEKTKDYAGIEMRLKVPQNVELEFASEGGRMVCRDFPAVLILRNRGKSTFLSDWEMG